MQSILGVDIIQIGVFGPPKKGVFFGFLGTFPWNGSDLENRMEWVSIKVYPFFICNLYIGQDLTNGFLIGQQLSNALC